MGVAQGLTRPGFDFRRNALSQLSLGDLGWVQVAGFLLTGALVLAGAVGARRALHAGPGERWVPVLLGVFGASFLAAAAFDADPGAGFPAGTPEAAAATLSGHGAVHMLSGMVGYLALCAAFVVLGRTFTARGRSGWAVASRLVPVAVAGGFLASAVTVLAFTTGAVLGLAWLTAVCVRLAGDGVAR